MIRSSRRLNVAESLVGTGSARWGARPAVRTPEAALTYEELAQRVQSLAGGLARHHPLHGRRVALVLPDSALWVTAFLALTRMGASVGLASPTTPGPRLRDAIARLDPDVVVSDSDQLDDFGARVDSATLLTLADSGERPPDTAPTRPNDPCYLLLTSGSTGPPKWAIHRHSDIPACIATYGRHVLALRPTDVTWSVASLSTSYGLGNSLYFPMGAGAAAWITGAPPTPAEAERACTAGGATVLFGVPTFWARLARHAAEGRVDPRAFRDVRIAVSAGEPLAGTLWQRVRKTLGLELVDGLGSSEATNLYLSNRPGRARPDSVGRVVPGFALRILDETGARVSDGDAGELAVHGPTVMAGYLNDPEATARALHDGWLRTGDLVLRRQDATYRFVGRVGERFKAGGSWVDPTQVERVLLSHPAVSEVAVWCGEDAAGVGRVIALVVAPGHDEDRLRAELGETAKVLLAPHEVPREVRFVAALPTAASGKIRRGELAALAQPTPEAVT